jgi:aerobic-type carbon monoxide dehydrogenase small subunit (CoxS/CutS family)
LRIEKHPILGTIEKGRKVEFEFDGKIIEGYEGEPIAFALRALGTTALRYTMRKHKPRGIFCAIGRCTDCVMIVDGKPNTRTCITPLRAGMSVKTQYGINPEKFDGKTD